MRPMSPAGFSRLLIALHWGIVLLVGSQLSFAGRMARSVDAAKSGDLLSAADRVLSTSHYWFAITIPALVLLRAAVRVTKGAPPPALGQPPVMQLAATATHFLLYLLLISG